MTGIIIMLLCIQLAIIIAGHRISNSLNEIAKELNKKQGSEE